MEEELTHYGVPGMKWGVRKQKEKREQYAKEAREAYASGKKRKATRLTKKSRSYTPGTQEFQNRQKRNRELATGVTLLAATLNSKLGRAAINVGKDYVNRRMAMNYSHKMNLKYGGIPDNAISKGLEFTKKKFGSYNISSL